MGIADFIGKRLVVEELLSKMVSRKVPTLKSLNILEEFLARQKAPEILRPDMLNYALNKPGIGNMERGIMQQTAEELPGAVPFADFRKAAEGKLLPLTMKERVKFKGNYNPERYDYSDYMESLYRARYAKALPGGTEWHDYGNLEHFKKLQVQQNQVGNDWIQPRIYFEHLYQGEGGLPVDTLTRRSVMESFGASDMATHMPHSKAPIEDRLGHVRGEDRIAPDGTFISEIHEGQADAAQAYRDPEILKKAYDENPAMQDDRLLKELERFTLPKPRALRKETGLLPMDFSAGIGIVPPVVPPREASPLKIAKKFKEFMQKTSSIPEGNAQQNYDYAMRILSQKQSGWANSLVLAEGKGQFNKAYDAWGRAREIVDELNYDIVESTLKRSNLKHLALENLPGYIEHAKKELEKVELQQKLLQIWQEARKNYIPENKPKKYPAYTQYGNPDTHFRIAREELARAAERGVEKVRFPVDETVMLAEGYVAPEKVFASPIKFNKFQGVDKPGIPLSKDIPLKFGDKVDNDVDVYIYLGESQTGLQAITRDRWVEDLYREIIDAVELHEESSATDAMHNWAKKSWERYNDTVQALTVDDMLEIINKFPDKSFLKNVLEESNNVVKKDILNPIPQYALGPSQQGVVNYYKNKLAPYLMRRHGGKKIWDEYGLPWIEVDVKPEHFKPVEAFGIPVSAGLGTGIGASLQEKKEKKKNPLVESLTRR